ncbi:indolepyruvate oxidoreductase subunit beta [uncultured Draconibacterium sp.]|uniref:indolepyruvate oxidoreductase subunit beta n=1 Tax=uncultured Draconibacterium sp. TaxID=1573823 RepID=UPI0025FF7415|nr:indolepyruvate oxidoreductase subunit beta [uncultured Draconibacterium sp.]
MKTDIILAGVGGQGILSIASIIGDAAINENLYLKQAETHGMSQRGGAVVSHLRIADTEIAADLIPMGKADLILSVEPMEALRYLPFLSPKGYVVTNTTPFINIPNYPELNEILAEIEKQPRFVAIDADKIAAEIGNKRASNVVMLGAATPFIDIEPEKIEAGIEHIFCKKGEAVVEMNLKAFQAGRSFALENK